MTVTNDEVRDLSEKVYRDLLERDSGPGAVARMLEKDDDGGIKLRMRAKAYDRLSAAYLRAFRGES